MLKLRTMIPLRKVRKKNLSLFLSLSLSPSLPLSLSLDLYLSLTLSLSLSLSIYLSISLTLTGSDKDKEINEVVAVPFSVEGSAKNFMKDFWVSIFELDEAATIIVTPDNYKFLGPLAIPASILDNYFHVTDRGSSFQTEFTGGMTTFLAMSYIMILNGKKRERE
jgi:hypothetical protein